MKLTQREQEKLMIVLHRLNEGHFSLLFPTEFCTSLAFLN